MKIGNLGSRGSWIGIALVGVLSLGSPGATAEDLTLRINDAYAEPGGLVAAVLRTYAPRPIAQGQICLGPGGFFAGHGSNPFASLEAVAVFSENGDADVRFEFDSASGTADLDFSSLTSSVNNTDGPLAVFLFRLADDLTPGTGFSIDFGAANTTLVGDDGVPITLRLREGEVSIVAPGSPHEIEADGEEVSPGGIAELAVSTAAVFPIGAGHLAVAYDPAIASGLPVVSMDPRHGAASWSADPSEPGVVRISFTSADGSLNSMVPGGLISIALPIGAAVPPGTISPVALIPGESWLLTPGGASLDLTFAPGVIEVMGAGVLFEDGFELGNTSGWTTVVQP